uniref:Uncharacterized protein n=1 Tax=Meloidogyne enterolobii TaxID=390850 RepID=A0A6V7X4B3_MELEN|nr:unnamed protein product [Meloidogyne enterolobii]
MQECPQEFKKKGWLCIIWLVGIDYEETNGESGIKDLDKINNAECKNILVDFKEKIMESYKPYIKDAHGLKFIREKQEKIKADLGFYVKYLNREEVTKWTLI